MSVFNSEEPLLSVTIVDSCDNYNVNALCDTGSSVSFINKNLVEKLRLKTYHSLGRFRSITNHFETQHKVKIKLQIGRNVLMHDFYVYDIPYELLIGRDLIALDKSILNYFNVNYCSDKEIDDSADIINDSSLQFLPVFNAENLESFETGNKQINHLINQYKSCFSQDCGVLPDKFQFKIDLVDTENRYKYIPPRRIPLHYQDEVSRQISDMLDRGIIERSDSKWSFPVVCTTKSNGKVRICFDARELNKITVKNKTVLPHFEEVLSRLNGASHFSALDITSGYLHVPVETQTQEYLTFCPGPGLGSFRFKRMPFGAVNAPSHFQYIMRSIFGDLSYVFIFIDDILIFSSSLEEHLIHLETIFKRLNEYNMKLAFKKCQFLKSEINYLGHTLKNDGSYTIPIQKKHLMSSVSLPHTYGELESFIGLINYYSKFVPNFSTLIAPLLKLKKETLNPKKSTKLSWTPNLVQTFEEIKNCIVNHTPLAMPDISKQFCVETDASDTGVGAVLLQNDTPVMYSSRVFTSAEAKYSTYEKELLAIIFALKKFRDCLIGKKFILRTDHKPLKWLRNQQLEGSSRISRWSLYLMAYEFDIEHIKGVLNNVADHLSRQSCNTMAVYIPKLYEPNIEQEQTVDDDIVNYDTSTKYCRYMYHLKKVDDVLYFKNRIVVPSKLTHGLLEHYHSVLGHCGIKRMYDSLKDYFFWPRMFEEITKFTSECSTCHMSKSYRTDNVQFSYTADNSKPFDSISMDLKTVKNNHILVIICNATRYAKFYKLCNKSSETVVDCLTTFIYSYGKPSNILSDCGLEFSGEFRVFLNKFDIVHIKSAPYHHEGNGLVERINRFIEEKIIIDDKFIQRLSYYESLHNNFVNSTTGSSPNDMIYRFNYRSPLLKTKSLETSIVKNHKKFKIGDSVFIKNINRKKAQPYYFNDVFKIVDIRRESFLLENTRKFRCWRHSSHVKLVVNNSNNNNK